jgi:hypothetical protein
VCINEQKKNERCKNLCDVVWARPTVHIILLDSTQTLQGVYLNSFMKSLVKSSMVTFKMAVTLQYMISVVPVRCEIALKAVKTAPTDILFKLCVML